MSIVSDSDCFEGRNLPQVIQDIEREYICWAMNKANGNKAEAARLAGIAYPTFTRKLGNLDLKVTYRVG